MTANCFVDSNILIYTHEKTPKSGRARQHVATLSRSHVVVISPQVVAEIFVNVVRVIGETRAADYCHSLIATTTIQPLDSATSESALRIRARYGFSFWDSQILAAAIASGARYLLTEDLQDGQVIDGVTVVNPFREGFDPSAL
jgi:predicted nucleic acid-binding protein